jgi:hypothetical protein
LTETVQPALGDADQAATVGLSFEPIGQIVVKADCQRYRSAADKRRLDSGLGWAS